MRESINGSFFSAEISAAFSAMLLFNCKIVLFFFIKAIFSMISFSLIFFLINFVFISNKESIERNNFLSDSISAFLG